VDDAREGLHRVAAKNLRVLVLVGGTSAEREVSLASGQSVIDALHKCGHQILAVDTANGRKLLDTAQPLLPQGIALAPPVEMGAPATSTEIVSALSLPETASVDVVFLALHGGDGEDGHIQALLDMARVPYTGSGATASALAMNKHLAKKIFRAERIPTPEWIFLDKSKKGWLWTSTVGEKGAYPGIRPPADNSVELLMPDYNDIVELLGLPFVIKPNGQGSTVGLSIVENQEEYAPALVEAFRHDSGVLLEQYIPGRELTVAILGQEALPVVEIIPEHGIYDYECKYTSGKSNYICPAKLTVDMTKRLQSLGKRVFNALGCYGYGRVDFRMNLEGECYCLEANTLPGMTSTSLVPKAAAAINIDFAELIERICLLAIK
jgi:D-alanine-D-alanine ligase